MNLITLSLLVIFQAGTIISYTFSSCFVRSQNLEKVAHLFVSLLSPPQAGPVVISEAQEVVVGYQAFNRVTHYVNVDGLCSHAKSAAQKNTPTQSGTK